MFNRTEETVEENDLSCVPPNERAEEVIRVLCLLICLSVYSVSGQRALNIEYDKDSLKEKYKISTLKFYLSKVEFHLEDGSWCNDEIIAHLIDLEDSDSWKIKLPKEIVKSKIDSISFLVGIDSTTNVAGILDDDLDPINGMYWAWNSGYINFKVEGEKKSSTKKFEYHLGGYLSPFSSSRKVVLSRDTDNKKLTLRIELNQFLDDINMDELNEVMIPGSDATTLSDRLSTCFVLE